MGIRIENGPIDFANPSIERMLRAVPELCWRYCRGCRHADLYRDCTLPAARCHCCGSADTRLMREATEALKAAAEPTAAADTADRCDHPWHRNPALTIPCPECGEGDDDAV